MDQLFQNRPSDPIDAIVALSLAASCAFIISILVTH